MAQAIKEYYEKETGLRNKASEPRGVATTEDAVSTAPP